MDTTFRTKRTKQDGEIKEEKNEFIAPEKQVTTEKVHLDPPYLNYEAEHGKPYLANYYELGDYWEVFNQEIGLLGEYIDRKVNTGEIANSVEAVKKEIKKMEKLNGLRDEPRATVKLGILSAYIKFLNEADGVKLSSRKYGNH